MPNDCTKCPQAEGCCTYYGGSMCHYTEDINRAAIARMEAHGRNDL